MEYVLAIEHLLENELSDLNGPVDIIYHRLFSEYIARRSAMVDGHLVGCQTDGDVVDTCHCHYFLETKPRKLVEKYLMDNFLQQFL